VKNKRKKDTKSNDEKKPCLFDQSMTKLHVSFEKTNSKKKRITIVSYFDFLSRENTRASKSNWQFTTSTTIPYSIPVLEQSEFYVEYTPCHDDNDPLQRRRFYNTYKDPNYNTQVFLTTKFKKREIYSWVTWSPRHHPTYLSEDF